MVAVAVKWTTAASFWIVFNPMIITVLSYHSKLLKVAHGSYTVVNKPVSHDDDDDDKFHSERK
jgi:hypothetical protein